MSSISFSQILCVHFKENRSCVWNRLSHRNETGGHCLLAAGLQLSLYYLREFLLVGVIETGRKREQAHAPNPTRMYAYLRLCDDACLFTACTVV